MVAMRSLWSGVRLFSRKPMERRPYYNLEIVLGGLGLTLENVTFARVFLTEFHRDYAAMNETYSGYFDAGKLPARTCVGVTGLAVDELVEIDLVAKRP